MHRIAISGHRGLPDLTADLVDKAIRAALAAHVPDVTGISCLADGADQIFARAVAALGGRLEVIIPAVKYRESTSESHMEASKLMIGQADELYAVWDGQPARGYGGTADVVTYAREHAMPVHIIWPDGAQRG
jgi:hypothetical protein